MSHLISIARTGPIIKRQIIALIADVALIAAPLMTGMAAAATPNRGRGPKMEQMTKQLNLTDAQTYISQVVHIYLCHYVETRYPMRNPCSTYI